MKRMVMSACLLTCLICGCMTNGNCARVGWRVEILQPPVVQTNGVMLVHQQPGQLASQVIGNVSGPIADHIDTPPLPLVPRAGATKGSSQGVRPLANPEGGCGHNEED